MKYSRSHLSDQTLLANLATRVSQHRSLTAELLADIAAVDERRLYLPAGYPSMYLYCVQELRLSEQAAFYRIRAARAARQFPAIFSAVADGRLHLSAVVLLAPHLTPGNADELLAGAAGKSKAEIEQLIAARFPRPDLPMLVRPIPTLSSSPACPQPSSGALGQLGRAGSPEQLSPGIVEPILEQHAPEHVEPPSSGRMDPGAKVAPLAPQRLALQLTMSQSTHDKLRYAQELLSHQVPAQDVAQVLDRALDALIAQLEKRKFSATGKPRRPRPSRSTRHVPAHVKRAVWERDGGRCTFVSEQGHRCPARTRLEFDHVDPVARGGRASVTGIRLRCRAHNQYETERAFGVEFMRHKRRQAHEAAAEARARAAAEGASAASSD